MSSGKRWWAMVGDGERITGGDSHKRGESSRAKSKVWTAWRRQGGRTGRTTDHGDGCGWEAGPGGATGLAPCPKQARRSRGDNVGMLAHDRLPSGFGIYYVCTAQCRQARRGGVAGIAAGQRERLCRCRYSAATVHMDSSHIYIV